MQRTHWHRERGTKGTKGYQHIESVVPKTQHVVPAECWGAERLTGAESVVPGVPRIPRGTNTESVVPKTQHVVPAEYCDTERLTGTERVVLRGTTHRVTGTKESTCGTSRVLGCRETHWK